MGALSPGHGWPAGTSGTPASGAAPGSTYLPTNVQVTGYQSGGGGGGGYGGGGSRYRGFRPSSGRRPDQLEVPAGLPGDAVEASTRGRRHVTVLIDTQVG